MATPPNANEPKSVSAILKQRQQSRSAAMAPRSGSKGTTGSSGPTVNENLNPVLPPLYPQGPKSVPLKPEIFGTVKTYNRFSQFFRSNFSVPLDNTKILDGFYLTRYTDQYKAPLALKPHLLHKLPDSKFPAELTKKTAVKSKPAFSRRKRRRIEDLSDDESKDESATKAKETPGEEEDDDEEKEENPNIEDIEEVPINYQCSMQSFMMSFNYSMSFLLDGGRVG